MKHYQFKMRDEYGNESLGNVDAEDWQSAWKKLSVNGAIISLDRMFVGAIFATEATDDEEDDNELTDAESSDSVTEGSKPDGNI